MFTTSSGVTGGNQTPGAKGTMGINVILDDDGAPLSDKFPFPSLQNDSLINVVVSPITENDDAAAVNSMWGQHSGGTRNFDGSKLPDGELDAVAVYKFVMETLPQQVAYNPGRVYFTGIGAGSLLLTGYFMPSYMNDFGSGAAGVALLCGGMQSAVMVNEPEKWAGTTRIHWQSTQQETPTWQEPLVIAIKGYEAISDSIGVLIPDTLQTVDNTPNAGHCAFDGNSLTTGVQAFLGGYSDVMYPGASGVVPGIQVPSLLTPVAGHEDLKFSPS